MSTNRKCEIKLKKVILVVTDQSAIGDDKTNRLDRKVGSGPDSDQLLCTTVTVWDYLDRKVRQRKPLPTNKDQLWEALQEEWANLPMEYINALYDSMPRRVQALKEAKGGYTRY